LAFLIQIFGVAVKITTDENRTKQCAISLFPPVNVCRWNCKLVRYCNIFSFGYPYP